MPNSISQDNFDLAQNPALAILADFHQSARIRPVRPRRTAGRVRSASGNRRVIREALSHRHELRSRSSAPTRDNDTVPIVPRGLVDQSKIRAGVQRAERALPPDVIRIMYSFGEDVQGNVSLFFRIILSDAASAPNRLRQTTQRITSEVLTEIKAEELGLQTYFNFRSRSEQATLKEPSWERQ